MIRFAKPMIGTKEKKAVAEVLSCDRLTEGPVVEEFERQFGERFGGYAVATSSCTAALHLAAMRYDPRIMRVPAMTHPATALAMLAAGHEVRFIDCDYGGLAKSDDVSVDFLGQYAMGGLYIEDAATALHHNSYAPIACFSFYPAKQMTTGEGGMVLCGNMDIADEIRSIRAFGKPDFDRFGLNYRMSEINAALGMVQLSRLSEFIEKRRKNEIALRRELEGLEVIGNNYALSIICPEHANRDKVRTKLLKNGVETSVYYPVPVPHTPYFGEDKPYPNAERISSRSITLSIGPHLTPKDMKVQGIMARELLSLEEGASSATILQFDSLRRDMSSPS